MLTPIHGKTTVALFVWLIFALSSHAQAAEDKNESPWLRPFGAKDQDQANVIFQTVDQGYLFAGVTDRNDLKQTDIHLVRTDSLGSILWMQTYSSLRSSAVYDMCQMDDGGFLLAGYTKPKVSNDDDAYVIRINSQGDTLWTRTYGGSGNDAARSIAKTADGGFLLAGRTNSFGNNGSDAYLFKIDSVGNLQWNRSIGGSDEDWANAVALAPDGGYILAGETATFGAGSYDIYVVRTDSVGNPLWWKAFGNLHEEEAYDVQTTSDHNYLIVGHTTSGRFGDEMYLLKIDDLGNLLWDNVFDYANYEYFNHMMVRPLDEGCLAAVYTFSLGKADRRMVLIRVDDDGEPLWKRKYDKSGGKDFDKDAGYWMSDVAEEIGIGLKRFYAPDIQPDSVSFSVDPPVILWSVDNPKKSHQRSYLDFSFELTHITTINVSIHPVTSGSSWNVINGRYESGRHVIPLNISQLAAGLYEVCFQADSAVCRTKMLVLK